MADVTLTCIIPTIGRDTLGAALASCEGMDEVIVVVDDGKAAGWQPEVYGANVRVLHFPACGRGGHAGRNYAIPHATGTHLCFLDDDDVYLPSTIDLFRRNACQYPVIFKMDHYRHGILWQGKRLEFGNVSTQMMLIPNDPDRLGVWEDHEPTFPETGGDYTFLKGCAEKMGAPIWHTEIVAKLRPDFITISIVTPWFNHPELLPDYGMAVSYRAPRDQLIVVDNGSDPPLGLPGVRLDENAGFSAGCNVGLRAADTDAVLFLNNDIVANSSEWLEPIRAALEPGVLVGANLRTDPHGDVDGQPMPYLDGWCLAGMTEDLRSIGGFDETFDEPSYYGDNDLCFRARLEGMTLREARVPLHHLTNRTSGGPGIPAISGVTFINRARYLKKVREALGAPA